MPPTSKAAIDWDLRFGEQAEHLEELADEGRMPAALEIRPDLTAFLADVREAFWFLTLSRGMTGGGMTPAHLQPISIADAAAIADAYGFDLVYFLRVIQPADALYREAVTARMTR